MFKIGDLVTRKSYNNDVIFTIIDFNEDLYFLKGKYIRLHADSKEEDLVYAVVVTQLLKKESTFHN